MAYTDAVLEHYNNPKNVGSLDKNANDVGTGLVGAPECGDVMKLQIRVENERIVDAKFKTFGCFVSNTPINTPTRSIKIKDLQVGDDVLAWNGYDIVPNKIKEIITREVPIDELIVVTFQRETSRQNINPGTFRLICTKEHVFWNANNKPILANDLIPGQELYEITEHELRKLTNVRHRDYIKKMNSKRMINFNKTFDHSMLPQNQKGYVCKNLELKRKRSANASIKNWKNHNYRKKWADGMAKIDYAAVTSIEQKYINLFEEHNVAAKYSAGKIWLQSSSGPVSPDFIVPGKKKCIEVYTKRMPAFMQDRSDESDYIKNRSKQLQTAGYESLFLAVEDFDQALEKVQNFIHNGIKILSVGPITHKNQLRGCQRVNTDVVVYDLKLEDGAHVYFSHRVGSHNCGSAIASSSLATEWVKGKTINEAFEIKNTEIVEELALPPVKIHCSVLAEDAIKAAIDDYRKKQCTHN